MERGWDEFNGHLERRQNKKYAVHWEVDRETLPFAQPFQEIREGFQYIEKADLAKSAESLARHEQANILQAIMYNETIMQGLLALNQLAWATGFPTGDYQEIQLTLSAQCKAKRGATSWFSRDKDAKLWIIDERMNFVFGAAKQFDRLLNSPERTRVEASIRSIAAGGGLA